MRVLVWIFSVLSVVVGFSAISIAVFGTLRARSKSPYLLLILFYGAYTLQTFITLIGEFALTGISAPPIPTVLIIYLIDTSLGTAVLAAAALYFHDLFSVRARRIRDILVIVAACATAVLFSPPFAVDMGSGKGIIVLGPSAYAAEIVYLSLFAYLLVVGFTGSKKDRPPRELVLLWSTLVFGSVGMLESLVTALQYARASAITIAYSEGGFPISIIPHILMGAVMIYYFGGYILADRLPSGGAVSEAFLKKFNISQREQEVIVLMDRGLSNREIAEKLFVSLATIKTHAHNVYEKTGAKSRYGLSHMIRAEKG